MLNITAKMQVMQNHLISAVPSKRLWLLGNKFIYFMAAIA
jgi:hypothetical protein